MNSTFACAQQPEQHVMDANQAINNQEHTALESRKQQELYKFPCALNSLSTAGLPVD